MLTDNCCCCCKKRNSVIRCSCGYEKKSFQSEGSYVCEWCGETEYRFNGQHRIGNKGRYNTSLSIFRLKNVLACPMKYIILLK